MWQVLRILNLRQNSSCVAGGLIGLRLYVSLKYLLVQRTKLFLELRLYLSYLGTDAQHLPITIKGPWRPFAPLRFLRPLWYGFLMKALSLRLFKMIVLKAVFNWETVFQYFSQHLRFGLCLKCQCIAGEWPGSN